MAPHRPFLGADPVHRPQAAAPLSHARHSHLRLLHRRGHRVPGARPRVRRQLPPTLDRHAPAERLRGGQGLLQVPPVQGVLVGVFREGQCGGEQGRGREEGEAQQYQEEGW